MYIPQDGLFQAAFAAGAAIIVIVAVIGIVFYIFGSIGLYTISKRRRLGTSGFAWIPYFRLIKLGQIADDAVLNKSGKKPVFRVLLPVFSIVASVLYSIGIANLAPSFIAGITPNMFIRPDLANDQLSSSHAVSQAVITTAIVFVVLGSLLVMAEGVLYYICLFHIYRSCSENMTALFVLSFIFSFLVPIFIFAIRKNDVPRWYIPGRFRA